MIGISPSGRGGRPADIAAHASQVAQEWEDVGEGYVRQRGREERFHLAAAFQPSQMAFETDLFAGVLEQA